jgi:hypothetical protein
MMDESKGLYEAMAKTVAMNRHVDAVHEVIKSRAGAWLPSVDAALSKRVDVDDSADSLRIARQADSLRRLRDGTCF